MTRHLYILVLLIGISFQLFAQSGRGPMSTTAIGHMCVTLLSPAAITSVQDLSFNNVSLRSSSASAQGSASLTSVDSNMQMAAVRVQGNKATYSVTVNNGSIDFNQNGRSISVDNFSATSNTDINGNNTIRIGATMQVNNTAGDTHESADLLAVTVNYN